MFNKRVRSGYQQGAQSSKPDAALVNNHLDIMAWCKPSRCFFPVHVLSDSLHRYAAKSRSQTDSVCHKRPRETSSQEPAHPLFRKPASSARHAAAAKATTRWRRCSSCIALPVQNRSNVTPRKTEGRSEKRKKEFHLFFQREEPRKRLSKSFICFSIRVPNSRLA